MPFIPEKHEIGPHFVQDIKLKQAFKWRETRKCFILTIINVIFIFGVLRDPSNVGLSKNNWLEYTYCILGCLFFYICYIIECQCNPVLRDLARTDRMPISEVSDYIILLKRAEPHVWWEALCYHFAEPKSPIRNPRPVTRVNMHVARASFNHRTFGYTDISESLVFSQRSQLVKIRFSKGFAFARPRHAEEFENIRNDFFSAHEPVDDQMDKTENFDLAGVEFEDYICAGRFPRLINTVTYWICSFILLSWPYRVYVNYNISHAHYTITKLFGNMRMIPSYSEAMLMDPAPPAYMADSPLPFDVSSQQSMTIFRTCSPNYVPVNLVRYIESGPYAYPPAYEDALRYPLFESSASVENNNDRAANDDCATTTAATRGSTAITFETSL